MVALTNSLFVLLAGLSAANAYWLMGMNFIVTERLDPIVSPGGVSGHAHSVVGGSNFGPNVNTALLRQSTCTSTPIPQDKSSYWFPNLYFQWANGSFTSLSGGTVVYYLFNDQPGTTTAFPDDFRMISGDPTLRTYDGTSSAQRAVTFLCLDFNGVSQTYNSLPPTACPSGIRAQINFPSCWDGKNVDSSDHKSHVAFLSGGPDSGTCTDPNYPITLPRLFMEVYWNSNTFDGFRSQAMNSNQPFVYSYGDPTGYGYHADFFNGWASGVLQKAVDQCHCNIYGDPTCCAQAGIFDLTQGQSCTISAAVNEPVLGTLPKLPGNNPVQPQGTRATMSPATSTPAIVSPVYVYTNNGNTPVATVAGPSSNGATVSPVLSSSSAVPSSSVVSSSVSSSVAASVTSSVVTSSAAPSSMSSSVVSSSIAPSTSLSTSASPSFVVVPSSSSSSSSSDPSAPTSSSSAADGQHTIITSSSAAAPTSSSSVSSSAAASSAPTSSASVTPTVISTPPVSSSVVVTSSVTSSSMVVQPPPSSYSGAVPAHPSGVPADGGNSSANGGSGDSGYSSGSGSSGSSSGSSGLSSGGQCNRGTRRKREAAGAGSAYGRPRARHASNHRRFNAHHA